MSRVVGWFLLAGEVFRSMMDDFLRSALQKSVPSIFVSIRVHYSTPEKVSKWSHEVWEIS